MPSWTGLIEPWPFVLGRELAGIFAIREWSSLGGNGVVRFRGRLLVGPETAMSLLAQRLEPYGYVPMIQSQEEITLLRRPAIRADQTTTGKGWVLNLVLFLATLLTTLFVGAMMEGAQPLNDPKALFLGVPFSASLLFILGFHELGHYLTARAYGVQVSLPYFVPLPLPPMGTMGAIIRMRSPIPNRKVLFDIGMAGPLAGLVLAVPVLAIGLLLSPVKPQSGVVLQEGNSLIYLALKWIVKGPIPHGSDVFLHPMALAGWLGLFVTALNLMPLSQLDGGHIAYAALGRRHHKVVWLFLGALVLLYFIARWEGWLVWVALAVALGLRHPPPLDDLTPLDPLRRTLAVVALVLLLTLITPIPFAVYEF